MKVYVIRDEDIVFLRTLRDRDPRFGPEGGSSQVVSEEEQRAYNEAHRFYQYQIERWIQKVTQ